MRFVHEITVFETIVVLILVALIMFNLRRNRGFILSEEGRAALKKRVGDVKKTLVILLSSMLLYLFSESVEIVGELFPERVDFMVFDSLHAVSEAVHLFLLVIGLWIFLGVINWMGED